MTLDDGYQRHSIEGLLTAAEYGDPSALEALKEFIRLRTGERHIIVERHHRQGWRVREPAASDDA